MAVESQLEDNKMLYWANVTWLHEHRITYLVSFTNQHTNNEPLLETIVTRDSNRYSITTINENHESIVNKISSVILLFNSTFKNYELRSWCIFVVVI